jgi:hypothetical protein
VRECCFEYAKTMLSHYDTELLEKHARVLSDMIRVRWGAFSLSSHPSSCLFRSHSLSLCWYLSGCCEPPS